MADATAVSWLTQEAFDRLTSELEHLSGEGRAEIAHKIEIAREEGDLKENGGYHAAKDEQGKIEARIRQLEDMLRRAQVGETPADDGIVELGMVVTIAYDGDSSDTETFLLGSREEGAHGDLPVYSPQSPLGKVIVGAARGEAREYELPNGKLQKVTIVEAKPFDA